MYRLPASYFSGEHTKANIPFNEEKCTGTSNASPRETSMADQSAVNDTNTASPSEAESQLDPDVATTTSSDDLIHHASNVELILPRIAALISLLAVICVAVETWKDIRIARGKNNAQRSTRASNALTISRIQFFFQIPLFCHAVGFVLGSTVQPEGMDIWGAVGSTASCDAQGLLLQFAFIANMGWDASLSTAFLIMVLCHNCRLSRLEKYCHILIWPSALAASIYPVLQDMYNPIYSICWLASIPPACKGDECIRGEGAGVWGNITAILAIIHLCYSITVIICIYCSIRSIENRSSRVTVSGQLRSSQDQESPSSSEEDEEASSHDLKQDTELPPNTVASNVADSAASYSRSRRASRAMGIQGLLYAGGIILTAFPIATYIIIFNDKDDSNDALRIFANSVIPLFGYINFAVFMRRRKVQDCHTQYAKLLRRAHGWIWHRRFVCKRGASNNQPVAADQTLPTAPELTSKKKHNCNELRSPGAGGRESQLAAIDEFHEGPEGHTASVSASPEVRTGYFVRLGEKGKRRMEAISEMECSTFERNDTSPSLPVRYRSELELPPRQPRRADSEVEDMDAALQTPLPHKKFLSCSDELPPLKPRRADSEVEDMDIVEHITSTKKRCAPYITDPPPAQPQRVQSCTSEGEDMENVQHATPANRRFFTSGNARPPVQPRRADSEVEVMDVVQHAIPSKEKDATSDNKFPPAMPQRVHSFSGRKSEYCPTENSDYS